MNDLAPVITVSPLRQRLIDDMMMRRFSRETQRNYIRDVGRLAAFLGRPPDTATAEDLRQFQIEKHDAGVPVPDDEQHRLGAARLLHAHARPPRSVAQAGTGAPSTQSLPVRRRLARFDQAIVIARVALPGCWNNRCVNNLAPIPVLSEVEGARERTCQRGAEIGQRPD